MVRLASLDGLCDVGIQWFLEITMISPWAHSKSFVCVAGEEMALDEVLLLSIRDFLNLFEEI